MKKCFKCGVDKEFSEFYKHPKMAGGVLNKCKKCTCADVKANREKNKDYYRAYDVQRYTVDKVRSRERQAYIRRYRNENPEKYKAHTAVSNALRKGSLTKPKKCPSCLVETKSVEMHGHHKDYGRPLDVEWMCVRCHANLHPREDWYLQQV